MKALLITLLTVLTVLTSACGKDSGVNVVLRQKTNHTPATVEQKALANLDATSMAAKNTTSSQAIRENITGISMMLIPSKTDTSKTSIDIEISQNAGANQCFISKFSDEINNSQFSNWIQIKDLGRLLCLDTACNNVLLLIEHSANQVTVGTELIAASVPVVLEDRNKDTKIETGSYLPTTSSSSVFLALRDEMNRPCVSPIKIESVTAAVLPTTQVPDYTYFPSDDYNTWY